MPYCTVAFLSGKQFSAVNTGSGENKNEKKEDFNVILPCNIFILGPFISCSLVSDFFEVYTMTFILFSYIYSPQPNSIDGESLHFQFCFNG